jgi:BioY family.
MPSAPSGS